MSARPASRPGGMPHPQRAATPRVVLRTATAGEPRPTDGRMRVAGEETGTSPGRRRSSQPSGPERTGPRRQRMIGLAERTEQVAPGDLEVTTPVEAGALGGDVVAAE